MPSTRTLTLCSILFFASALISLSLRTSGTSGNWPSLLGQKSSSPKQEIPPAYRNVAFATFLAGDSDPTHSNSTDENDDMKDGYFLGARVLTYALLHAKKTRTVHNIPFIVLVTPEVTERKRARLISDGATVVVADKIDATNWMHIMVDRWRDTFGKLRLFQLTKFRKICFIDADHLVTNRLDGIFEDPATDLQQTRLVDASDTSSDNGIDPANDAIKEDEGPLPSAYLFAGKPDAYGYQHDIPPKDSDYLNSGFFVFQPSDDLFKYYMRLLTIEGRFDFTFPDQGLLNYAHRRNGAMPWRTLGWRWNANWPTVRDWEAGRRSFHAKYWDGDATHDEILKRMWEKQRAEMEGYYWAKEEGAPQWS